MVGGGSGGGGGYASRGGGGGAPGAAGFATQAGYIDPRKRPVPGLPYVNTQGPNTNLYAGLNAFNPLIMKGDVATKFWRMRGGGLPNGSGVDPLAGLNTRAMAVLGLSAPQSQSGGQGYGFGGSADSDILKRLLAARLGTM